MKWMQRPAPRDWHFNDADREKYRSRFWKCPTALVKDGLWASLWREEGTKRGGGSVSSVLPVLALHARLDAGDAIPNWTHWTYLSQRRIARLAGVDKDTVAGVFRRLQELGLADLKREPRGPGEGGQRIRYRLSSKLFAQEGEDWVRIPSSLFYGGAWAVLPTAAARHLFVTIACLDPVRDEEAFLKRIADDHGNEVPWEDLEGRVSGEAFEYGYEDLWEDHSEEQRRMRFLAAYRASHPLPTAVLVQHSGLSRSTIWEALRILTRPMFGRCEGDEGEDYEVALLAFGGERVTWFAPDRRAYDCYFLPESLVSVESIEEQRWDLWPWLFKRSPRPRRSGAQKNRRADAA